MGIDRVGQVCIMIHSGSRGLGHQVATDSLISMENAMARYCLVLSFFNLFILIIINMV